MKTLLHTSIIYAYVRGEANVIRNLHAGNSASLALSSISLMEGHYAMQRIAEQGLANALTQMFSAITVLPFDHAAAVMSGRILAKAEAGGISLSFSDAQICGHALAHDVALATTDVAGVAIPGLRVIDWS